jgi:hypothetical protein
MINHPPAAIARRALLLTALLFCGCATQSRPVVGLSTSPNQPATLSVQGLDNSVLDSIANLPPEQRQAALRVWVADAPPDSPPVLGEVARRGGVLVFTPRYPFQPGLKYRAQFEQNALGNSGSPTIAQFTISAPSKASVTRVIAIYPSSSALPENLLKFYIHFSSPMSRGEAYERISLLDETGKPVARPFLELSEELWNPDMTRFTLFFEPGRIKQGLVPREELGPSLTPGHSYTLLIDGAWRDGENRPLVESSRKTFRVGPADHAQPDPSRWQINSPGAGSKQELSISFDKPLDHAMLGRVLSVRDGSGRELPGDVSIDEHEQRWSFTPRLPWQRGRHVVVVESILEDLAGNSVARPFEVDLNRGSSLDKPELVEIRFDVTYRTMNKD